MMVFLLAGIVGMCGFLCCAEGAVWLWEQIEAAEERKSRRERRARYVD